MVGNNKTLTGLCYRAPSNIKTNDEALYSLISKASTENLVLMGDFNFPEINWSVPESLSEEHSFIKCTNNAYLFQNVLDSTRGKNILDLVLSSEENMIENLEVGEPFGTSDHQIIRWKLVVCKGLTNKNKKVFNYFKTDYSAVRREVQDRNWQNLIGETNVEENWLKLKMS